MEVLVNGGVWMSTYRADGLQPPLLFPFPDLLRFHWFCYPINERESSCERIAEEHFCWVAEPCAALVAPLRTDCRQLLGARTRTCTHGYDAC